MFIVLKISYFQLLYDLKKEKECKINILDFLDYTFE